MHGEVRVLIKQMFMTLRNLVRRDLVHSAAEADQMESSILIKIRHLPSKETQSHLESFLKRQRCSLAKSADPITIFYNPPHLPFAFVELNSKLDLERLADKSRWLVGDSNVKIRRSDLREREWYAIHDRAVLYLAEIHGLTQEVTRHEVGEWLCERAPCDFFFREKASNSNSDAGGLGEIVVKVAFPDSATAWKAKFELTHFREKAIKVVLKGTNQALTLNEEPSTATTITALGSNASQSHDDSTSLGSFDSVDSATTQVANGLAPVYETADDEFYDLSQGAKRVLVFNQVFQDTQRFAGSAKKDCDAIESTFEEMGFRVTIYNDLKRSKILDKLRYVSKVSCLAVFFLTQGDDEQLLANDDTLHVQDVVEALSTNCHLDNRPKMLFLQTLLSPQLDSLLEQVTRKRQLPRDFVLYHATAFYDARRGGGGDSTGPGTIMIRSLCSELRRRFATDDDLFKILTHVNAHLVSAVETELAPSLQLGPTFVSSFRRSLCFRAE